MPRMFLTFPSNKLQQLKSNSAFSAGLAPPRLLLLAAHSPSCYFESKGSLGLKSEVVSETGQDESSALPPSWAWKVRAGGSELQTKHLVQSRFCTREGWAQQRWWWEPVQSVSWEWQMCGHEEWLTESQGGGQQNRDLETDCTVVGLGFEVLF